PAATSRFPEALAPRRSSDLRTAVDQDTAPARTDDRPPAYGGPLTPRRSTRGRAEGPRRRPARLRCPHLGASRSRRGRRPLTTASTEEHTSELQSRAKPACRH